MDLSIVLYSSRYYFYKVGLSLPESFYDQWNNKYEE